MQKFIEKVKALFTLAVRRRIYKIAAIIGTILVARGLMTAEDMMALVEIIGLALAVVGVPAMAASNTRETVQ